MHRQKIVFVFCPFYLDIDIFGNAIIHPSIIYEVLANLHMFANCSDTPICDMRNLSLSLIIYIYIYIYIYIWGNGMSVCVSACAFYEWMCVCVCVVRVSIYVCMYKLLGSWVCVCCKTKQAAP